MSILNKNLIMEGPFSVETPDTSGEVLMISGADISELQSGQAHLNTEHIGPEDADDEEKHKDKDGNKLKSSQGFQTIIGRVVNAKKIFSDQDCASDKELASWKMFQKPMIYGTIEIYDGPEAHENAKAAASLARMFRNIENGPKFGLSVEGATVKRNGNILESTIIRAMAGTLKPANRAATIDIVKDTASPEIAKSMLSKTVQGGYEPLHKSVAMQNMHCVEMDMNLSEIFDVPTKLANALSSLRKSLTAGGTNGAPSSLTGGSALQSESQLSKLVKLMGSKPVSRASLKQALPHMSDEDVEKVEKALKAQSVKKTMNLMQNAYEKMTGKKS